MLCGISLEQIDQGGARLGRLEWPATPVPVALRRVGEVVAGLPNEMTEDNERSREVKRGKER